jgi:hypothetical protein
MGMAVARAAQCGPQQLQPLPPYAHLPERPAHHCCPRSAYQSCRYADRPDSLPLVRVDERGDRGGGRNIVVITIDQTDRGLKVLFMGFFVRFGGIKRILE